MITYKVTVVNNGSRRWYVGDKLNRLDGPAYEGRNGRKAWYIDGKLHRLDGPAIEWNDGYKAWYIDGKLHRLDGPAIEWCDGYKAWYIDDIKLTESQFLNRTKKKISCAGKVVEVDGVKYKLVEA